MQVTWAVQGDLHGAQTERAQAPGRGRRQQHTVADHRGGDRSEPAEPGEECPAGCRVEQRFAAEEEHEQPVHTGAAHPGAGEGRDLLDRLVVEHGTRDPRRIEPAGLGRRGVLEAVGAAEVAVGRGDDRQAVPLVRPVPGDAGPGHLRAALGGELPVHRVGERQQQGAARALAPHTGLSLKDSQHHVHISTSRQGTGPARRTNRRAGPVKKVRTLRPGFPCRRRRR